MFITNEIKRKILIVDDNINFTEFTGERLKLNGFDTDSVYNGREAINTISDNNYSLILLDINLPDKDGFSIIKSMRLKGIYTPAIIMTDYISEENQFLTYHNRANIFHPKPLKFNLLIEQINLLTQDQVLKCIIDIGDFHIDYGRKVFSILNKAVYLTPKEFNLMFLFMNYPNTVLTRRSILRKLDSKWLEVEEHSVDTLVSRLKRRLGNYGESNIIKTVHSIGFKLLL